jgi:hypothetical protein
MSSMHRGLLKALKQFIVFLTVGMAATTLPRAGSSLVYNLIMVLSGVTTPGNASGSIWYGMGSHRAVDAASLVEWTISQGMVKEACHDQERVVLGMYTRLPFRFVVDGESKRRDAILRARYDICQGRADNALQKLEEVDGTHIQQMSVWYLLNRGDRVASLAAQLICDTGAKWCDWCVGQMLSLGEQTDGQSISDTPIWRYTNDLGGRYLGADMVFLSPLVRKWAINVEIARRVPFTIRNVAPKESGDNYIEYLTMPITGSVVRYRIRGLIRGEDAESCIYPRLVFWGERGKYLGEVAPRYVIKGRFDIELWWPLTTETKEVTPRISFDQSCFAEGQEIAICSVDLAVNP